MAELKDSYKINMLIKGVTPIRIKNKLNDLLFAIMLTLISGIVLTNCDTAEPPPLPPALVLDTVTVNIIDQTHRSLTVEVKTTVNNKNWQIELWREYDNANTLLAEFNVAKEDIVITDDNNGTGLQEGTAYNYYTVLKDSTGEEKAKSEKTTGITVKPTSHEFSYEIYELGDNGINNILSDVAIINENNVWAVGEIYTFDYDRKVYDKFSVAHWDGEKWELKLNGDYSNIWAILAFNENDIWISPEWHWNGEEFINVPFLENFNSYVNAMWGTSSSDITAVGNSGVMAHYDGSNWTPIANPVENRVDKDDIQLTGIYGKSNDKIYVGGTNYNYKEGIVISGTGLSYNLVIEGSTIDTTELFTTKLYGGLGSIWADEMGAVYAGGKYLYKYKNSKWDFVEDFPGNYLGANINPQLRGTIYGIKGNSSCDYIVCGSRNLVMHYNGKDFQTMGNGYNEDNGAFFYQVDFKDNIAVAVGFVGDMAINGTKASIIMLRR